MPVVIVDRITRPEHGVEAISQILKESDLPVEVVKYDTNIVETYPLVQVMSGGFEKEIHGTHTWLFTIRIDLYVMHARLTQDRQTRNLEDLVLATQVVNLLESSINGKDPLSLGGRCIAGWVEREQPGRMPPSGITKGKPVIGTLLSFRCTNEGRF